MVKVSEGGSYQIGSQLRDAEFQMLKYQRIYVLRICDKGKGGLAHIRVS